MNEAALIETVGEALEGTRTVRLRVPARAEYVALARLALSGLGDIIELSDELLADLKLALTEAVSNAVSHAYPDESGFVTIAYELTGAALVVEVAYDGPGFDPDQPPPLALIRSIADEFELCSRPGLRGSRLRFVKRLRQPA